MRSRRIPTAELSERLARLALDYRANEIVSLHILPIESRESCEDLLAPRSPPPDRSTIRKLEQQPTEGASLKI